MDVRSETTSTLVLNSSFNNEDISDKIKSVIRSPSYNALECCQLNLSESDDLRRDLFLLVRSRNWQRIFFDRCTGIDSFFDDPTTRDQDFSIHPVEVDHLYLRLPSETRHGNNKNRKRSLFFCIFCQLKVHRLRVWMELTSSRIQELTPSLDSEDFFISDVKELVIDHGCVWRRQLSGNTHFDSWKQFCQNLSHAYPKLKALLVKCKTEDRDLAYLINHILVPQSFEQTLEILRLGKQCCCGEETLLALTNAMARNGASNKRDCGLDTFSCKIKELSMSRGAKVPSDRVALCHERQRGFLNFCRALESAHSLTRLELSDYVMGHAEFNAILKSLVQNGGKIERMWFLHCRFTHVSVYDSLRDYLSQLPSLRNLYLPYNAVKLLGELLESNTSLEYVNLAHGGSPTLNYYIDLNRGGRRIMERNQNSTRNIPAALYPLVLERASAIGERYCFGGEKRQFDVIYTLLRNRILLEN